MNTIKKIFIALLPVAALAAVVVGLVVFMNRMPKEFVHHLAAPTWSRPDVVRQGKYLFVTLNCDVKPEVESAVLKNTVFGNELEYTLKVRDVVFDEKKKQARVKLQTPKVLPEFMYDLSVKYTSGIDFFQEFQPNAVKVQGKRDGTFTFAVLSRFSFHKDLEKPGVRQKRILDVVEELNVMNPDFVVVAGGMANNTWTANRDSREIFEIVRDNARVPFFVLPNENDIGRFVVAGKVLRNGPKAWGMMFGEPHFSFDYEGYRFIGVNSFSCKNSERKLFRRHNKIGGCVGQEELEWLTAQLEEAKSFKVIPILFMHHNPGMEKWTGDSGLNKVIFSKKSRSQILELCKRYEVKAVFSGHLEKNSVAEKDGTYFITTGVYNSKKKLPDPALRLISFVEGELQKQPISYVRTPDSVPFGNVSSVYRKKNDGSAKDNTVTVKNSLKRPLNNVSVVLKMARKEDNREYKIDGRAKTSQSVGRSAQYVFMYFDLLPGKKKIIRVE